ncbi:MAG TPA: BON domain-containing protein [Candidatus Polarisedimenticolia bacterium]|nr:BON domain-containing protein [Candidatus Polarisedimenticolia bacterium]
MKLGLQKTFRIAWFAPLLSGGWVVASAQQSIDPQSDNTKMNQRDRNSNEATADQQEANRSDRDITQQIRRSIARDKSLSRNGHNVESSRRTDGTRRRPVPSEEEKQTVEENPAEVAGGDKVTNEIDVQPKH